MLATPTLAYGELRASLRHENWHLPHNKAPHMVEALDISVTDCSSSTTVKRLVPPGLVATVISTLTQYTQSSD